MTAIVAKFGGTSVADAQAIARSASIVASNPEVRVVVVSATAQTTNKLEEFASKSLNRGEEALNLWERIHKRHLEIATELGAGPEVFEQLHDIFCEGESLALRAHEHGALIPELMDVIYSLGERMSSPLFAFELKKQLKQKGVENEVVHMDAREVLWSDDNFLSANPLKESIYESAQRLIPLRTPGTVYVTQGFIGSTLDGRTTTFGREGSDFSAALLAEALRAKELQIWTDVPGIASCDPRVVEGVRWIKELDFEEASALAEGGAKVLFPKTLSPVRELGIPVFVGSSLMGGAGGGTWIMNLSESLSPRMVALSFDREGITLVGFRIEEIADELLEKIKTLSFDIRSVEKKQHGVRIVLNLENEERQAIKEIHDYFGSESSEYISQ